FTQWPGQSPELALQCPQFVRQTTREAGQIRRHSIRQRRQRLTKIAADGQVRQREGLQRRAQVTQFVRWVLNQPGDGGRQVGERVPLYRDPHRHVVCCQRAVEAFKNGRHDVSY